MSIQGHLLEVTVVGCNRLRDTEWISRQDPYVCLEYASTKYRTRTCTDGGKNPTFQEKFVFNLIEGLREINVSVWNSNTITADDLIGSGKVQLTKVLSQGYDDTAWTIHRAGGKHSGELSLIMHYSTVQKPGMGYVPTAPHYPTAAPPPPFAPAYPAAPYAPAPAGYPPAPAAYAPPPSGYPPAPTPSSYPPAASPAGCLCYPAAPAPYPAAVPAAAYPPAPVAAAMYPPAAAAHTYPPAPTAHAYPPAAYSSPAPPPGPYSVYPPPPTY